MTATAGPELREPAGPRVVVTVGTDHHPFDRIIGWINDWLDAHPQQVRGFFVQSGAASVVPACPGSRFLDVGRLDAVLDEADVIVCHGGPASIAAAWARGLLPIVVPRRPQLGEHVDDHQVRFCLKLAELGRVWLAQTPAEFASKLAEAARDPARLRADVPAADVDAAVERFGELVEELVGRPRRRLPLWHRSRRVPHRPVTGPLAVAVNMQPGHPAIDHEL
jgi:UDP-N-acetylglucosamine transferase subunit ALG13